MLAAVLGAALVIMPLLILSYDPGSKLERLREPLCRPSMVVTATNASGGTRLLVPESGVRSNVSAQGQLIGAHLILFVRDPGQDWKVSWQLEAPAGGDIFVLDGVKPGTQAYVRATNGTGQWCPADSPTLTAS